MTNLPLYALLLAAFLGSLLTRRAAASSRPRLIAAVALLDGLSLVGALLASAGAPDATARTLAFAAVVSAAAGLTAAMIVVARLSRAAPHRAATSSEGGAA